jgi:hypothetical protein
MKSIGEQLIGIIERKAQSLDVVAETAVRAIGEKMEEQTKGGQTFPGETYVNLYDKRYAEANKKPRSPVTMRNGSNRIEEWDVKKSGKGARLDFFDSEIAIIFRYHHEGTATGGKIRTLFPKSGNAVPLEIKSKLIKDVAGALTGV